MKQCVIAFLPALCAVALSGCLSARTSGVMVEKGRLFIEDPAFAANIEVVQDFREKTPEGFLHAQVTVKNTNRTDYECQYCFEWREESGIVMIHVPTPWRPCMLHGRETQNLDAICPRPGAEDFRLKIRRAD